MARARLVLLVLPLVSCSATSSVLEAGAHQRATTSPVHTGDPITTSRRRQPPPPVPRSEPVWEVGQPLLQGFLGFSSFTEVAVDGSGSEVDGDDGDLDELPLIGGGGQWKLGGERVDYGLEGLLSFAGRANATAFAAGGSGAAVAVDVDLLLFELYGGPFASVFLGDKLRLYGAAGPLAQFAEYDQDDGGALEDSGSGFGVGLYARTGLELRLPAGAWLGIGVRWSDSEVDLGGDLGDLQIEGFQGLITLSRGP